MIWKARTYKCEIERDNCTVKWLKRHIHHSLCINSAGMCSGMRAYRIHRHFRRFHGRQPCAWELDVTYCTRTVLCFGHLVVRHCRRNAFDACEPVSESPKRSHIRVTQHSHRASWIETIWTDLHVHDRSSLIDAMFECLIKEGANSSPPNWLWLVSSRRQKSNR